MNKTIILAGMLHESLVNGPGLRRVLFAQGCTHHCKGCFSPHTWDINAGTPFDMDSIIDDIVNNCLISGVTFSGGDPFEQAEKFSYIANQIKLKKPNINIWCYSGYVFEHLQENPQHKLGWSELLEGIDVLVDGKFDINLKQEGLKFKGSSNQRLINVKKSISNSKTILISDNF